MPVYYDAAADTAADAAEKAYRARVNAFNTRAGAGAVPPVPPTTALGRMATGVPTITRGARVVGGAASRAMRGVSSAGRFVPGLAVAADAIRTGTELGEVATDPVLAAQDVQSRIADFATPVARSMTRLGTAGTAAGLTGLAVAPMAATGLGAIPAALLTGAAGVAGYMAPDFVGSAIDRWRNRSATPAPAAPAATPAAPLAFTPTVQDLPYDPAGFGVEPSIATPTSAPAPFTAEDVRGARVPARGTGAILNTRTGTVTNLDTRGAEPIAVPVADGSVGSYVGALMNQRRAAAIAARDLAVTKAGLQYGGTAAKNLAAAENEELRTAAAIAHLQANPGDFAGAAAAAAGRAQPPKYSVPFPPMSDTGPVTRIEARSGAIERVVPRQQASKADFEADVKRLGSKERVLAEYARRNITPPKD